MVITNVFVSACSGFTGLFRQRITGFTQAIAALFQRLLGFAAQFADSSFDLSVEEFSTSSRVSARDFNSARRFSDVVSFDMIFSCETSVNSIIAGFQRFQFFLRFFQLLLAFSNFIRIPFLFRFLKIVTALGTSPFVCDFLLVIGTQLLSEQFAFTSLSAFSTIDPVLIVMLFGITDFTLNILFPTGEDEEAVLNEKRARARAMRYFIIETFHCVARPKRCRCQRIMRRTLRCAPRT
jgi:hypothetical protein